MNFTEFRKYLESNKASIYNHIKNHLWENDFNNFYLHVLPSKNDLKPDRTRAKQGGAHFLATRFVSIDKKKAFRTKFVWKKPIYFSKHIEVYNNKYHFVIRKDVLISLKSVNGVVFFEDTITGQGYTCFAEVKDILKCNELHESLNQQGVKKVYLPFDLFDFYKKDYTPLSKEVSFDPKYLGNYRFHFTAHGVSCNMKVLKGEKTIDLRSFSTLKEMFDVYQFEKKGAKLETIQGFYRNKKNFILDGLTFIFNDNWDIVEYKVRLSAKQKALIEDIKAKEAELAKEQPEEEIIVPIETPKAIEESEEDIDGKIVYTLPQYEQFRILDDDDSIDIFKDVPF